MSIQKRLLLLQKLWWKNLEVNKIGKPHSEFNIFDYIDEDQFLQIKPPRQKLIADFIKAFHLLVKDQNYFIHQCVICGRSSKNRLCKWCIIGIFRS